MIRDENFVCIQGWMINQLNLKGNDLLIYALIYGFTQDGQNWFEGSRQYIADWCNATKSGVQKNLQNLCAKGMIIKEDVVINNVKFCKYKANLTYLLDKSKNEIENKEKEVKEKEIKKELKPETQTTKDTGNTKNTLVTPVTPQSTKLPTPSQQSCPPPSQQSCPNNIDLNNIDNIDSKSIYGRSENTAETSFEKIEKIFANGSDLELEYVNQWYNKLKLSDDEILNAYDQSMRKTGKYSIIHINRILENYASTKDICN